MDAIQDHITRAEQQGAQHQRQLRVLGSLHECQLVGGLKNSLSFNCKNNPIVLSQLLRDLEYLL